MYLNYTTYAYYQDSLVMMSMRFPGSNRKECFTKRQRPGRIFSVSEEEIKAIIGAESTKTCTTTISTKRNEKHQGVLVSVKKAKIGASRRSRHLNKQVLRIVAR